ncbi:MAG: hypothetical protein IKC17_00945 [Bacteroidales bacterium]|nr:hypothetical protein [Bacteroidales bacterium]
MNSFVSEVEKYLVNLSVPIEYHIIEDTACYICTENSIVICPIEISSFPAYGDELYLQKLHNIKRHFPSYKIIYLYQDKWITQGTLVRGRLLTQLNRGKSIFARNCIVKEISGEQAAIFLNKHHLYGATKAKIRYGLFRNRATGSNELGMEQSPTLVAVATFSAGRKNINGTTSYEWERYASVAGTRIVGGMGKILKHFVSEREKDGMPLEIMSYSDTEWSDGEVYLKLGFTVESYKEPVKFIVEKETFRRIHYNKIGRDRAYPKEILDNHNGYTFIYNLGSTKFTIKDFSKPLSTIKPRK